MAQISNRLKNKIKKKIIEDTENKIEKIHGESQSKVPIDTGFLKGSWFKRTEILDEDNYQVTFGYGAHYAIYVDWGTYKMQARKYFTPIVYKTFGVPDPTPYK